MTSAGWLELCLALSQDIHLNLLDVSLNNLFSNGTAVFALTRLVNSARFRKLKLNNTALGTSEWEPIRQFFDSVRTSSALSQLSIASNPLGDTAGLMLANALLVNDSLYSVDFSGDPLRFAMRC